MYVCWNREVTTTNRSMNWGTKNVWKELGLVRNNFGWHSCGVVFEKSSTYFASQVNILTLTKLPWKMLLLTMLPQRSKNTHTHIFIYIEFVHYFIAALLDGAYKSGDDTSPLCSMHSLHVATCEVAEWHAIRSYRAHHPRPRWMDDYLPNQDSSRICSSVAPPSL